jgi:hypothetical protein
MNKMPNKTEKLKSKPIISFFSYDYLIASYEIKVIIFSPILIAL